MQVCVPQLEEKISAIGKDGSSWSSLIADAGGEAIAASYPTQVCLALLFLKGSPSCTLLV